MTPKDLKNFERRLVEERFSLMATLREATRERDIEGDEFDQAAAMIQASTDKALLDRSELRLKQVEQALYRLNHGVFGACGKCRDEIEDRRLDVNPAAVLCFDCAESFEINKRRGIAV